MLQVTTNNVNTTLDETAGLQNFTSSSSAGDKDDNDILVSSLPSTFSGRLGVLGANTSSAIGAALSGYTGAAGDTGSNVISVTGSTGATITDLGFVGSSGEPLKGADSGLDTIDGTSILLFTDTNNNIVLGRAGTPDGQIVFALYLEETGSPVSGGKIWSVQYAPLKNPNAANPDDAVDLANQVFVAVSQDLQFSLAGAPS